MTAEALIGWSEAAFVVVGLLAIIVLIARVFHPANRSSMADHASIPFRGEDAPETVPSRHAVSRHDHHG